MTPPTTSRPFYPSMPGSFNPSIPITDINIVKEILACGVDISRIDDFGIVLAATQYKFIIGKNDDRSEEIITDENDSEDWIRSSTIVELVKAAHEKDFSSLEIIELKNYLGEFSKEWLAYVDLRKDSTKARRSEMFARQADALYLQAVEKSAREGTPLDLTEWLAAKDSIRNLIQYPEL